MSEFYSEFKAVYELVRRKRLTFPGKILEKSDVDTLKDILIYQYYLLKDISPGSQLACRKYVAFFGMPDILDVRKYAETFNTISRELKNTIEELNEGKSTTFRAFKERVKVAGYTGLLTPVADLFEQWFENPDPTIFKRLLAWSEFPRRANLRSLDLTSEMEVEYLQLEAEMETWDYPSDILVRMNEILREWLHGFSSKNIVGRHGPGSIAAVTGRPTIPEKYLHMSSDTRLDYFYKRSVGHCLRDDIPVSSPHPLDRTSEIVCVPKTILKNRTISKEPVALQFVQQGLMQRLDEWFQENPSLRRHIDLHRQDLSQDLAREGSITGKYATIDLSNASDTVTYNLVKAIFRNTPLYSALICTRSTKTRLPSEKEVELQKFAPMGSALCFPIECLVFAAVCEVARRGLGVNAYYRVYGDDIVLDERLVDRVLLLLNQLHFQVNTEKSFWNVSVLNYREACGGEYLNNVDVTPLRISRRYKAYDAPTGKISKPDTVSAFIDFANTAFQWGAYMLRRCILCILKMRFKMYDELAFHHTNLSCLLTFSHVDVNFHLQRRMLLRHRFRPVLHRLETKSICFKAVEDKARLNKIRSNNVTYSDIEEKVRYYEWFRARAFYPRSEDLVFEREQNVRPVRPEMTVQWHYITK